MAEQPFANIVARDVMSRDLITASPEQSLVEVRHTLIESRIGGAPVVSGGRLVGVISRSDLIRIEELVETLDAEVSDNEEWLDDQADGFQHPAPRRFEGFHARLKQLRVKDAMRSQVVTCSPETPIGELALEMTRQRVHRIVVVEKDRPVGIVSTLDIVKLVAGTKKP
jgi:predicted transcriptional regulator